MFQRSVIFFVLLLLCNCSTTPVKKQNVVLSKDYKGYITLKEEPEHKTISQKIKDVFKKKEPEVQDSDPKPPKSSRRINIPKRRLRQTDTNNVSVASGELMPMNPRPQETIPEPKSNIIVYFIYIQAFIIAVLSVYIYWKLRKRKVNKPKPERKLNL
tara:strand:+ start:1231 stop:1701 length:471 start_codon:yes stop_codon:yes gene_type:complete